MFELKFIKTKQPNNWPIKAIGDNFTFVFSGQLNQGRIKKENLRRILEISAQFFLWLILALGLAALAINIWASLRFHNWFFILAVSPSALIFWVSCYTTAYLWAKQKQRWLNRQILSAFYLKDEITLSQTAKKTLDVYELFDEDTKKTWDNTLNYTKKYRTKNLGPQEASAIDLLLSLIDNGSVEMVFLRLGVNIEDIRTILKNYVLLSPGQSQEELSAVPFLALAETLKLHNKIIDPLMLLCGLVASLKEDHIIKAILFNIDLDLEKLETLASWIFHLKLLRDDFKLFEKLSKFKPAGEINKGLTSLPTFFLDRFGQDMTLMAKYGRLPLALGRNADLLEIFQLLADGRKNLIVKGEAGSGRTTLINELAYKMATEQVPAALQDKRLVRLEIAAILGNAQKSEYILVHALKEALASGNIILIIEDLHELSKAYGAEGLSLLEILLNFLQSHPLTAIGTTTVENYTDYLKSVADFESVFTSYELRKLTRNEILLACCIRASILEAQNRCLFRYQAIEKAVDLTDLYIKGLGQPQKTISILVEAASRAKGQTKKIITENQIQQIISEKTHIPAQTLGEEETEKLLHLEELLSKYIVGQNQAVVAVAEGLRRARSGIASKNRPLASFLFLGPTGVGKTEVARTLASVYFGDNKYLLRVDMSEYQGSDGINKFLGTPEGKIDSVIIKHIKNYPFCLLLLDEFEKAGPEILNLFLQILEDGRLTTAKGETVDLTHALIIATSNAGSREIQEGIRKNLSMDQIKTKLFSQTLTQIFPPELLNRFDGIVVFSPLSPNEIEQVSLLQLEYLKKELLNKGVKAEFSGKVIKDIAQKAFDPQLGARPIRRYIQDHLESFVAKLLLSKKIARGSKISIDLVDEKYILK
ncbi:MAG: AAA family ATPase [Candidatus Doudnabacteria bacterium]|nr:AAA family ATPase [Candidatus Doudnabacteria bacterium]